MTNHDSAHIVDPATRDLRTNLLTAVRKGYHPKTAAIIAGAGRRWLNEQLTDPAFAAEVNAVAAAAPAVDWHQQALDVLESGTALGAAVARRIGVPWNLVRSEFTHNTTFRNAWLTAEARGVERLGQNGAGQPPSADQPATGARSEHPQKPDREIKRRRSTTRHNPADRQALKDTFLDALRRGLDQRAAARETGRAITSISQWAANDAVFRDAWAAIMEQRRSELDQRKSEADQVKAAQLAQQQARREEEAEQKRIAQQTFLAGLRSGLFQYEAAAQAGVSLQVMYKWKDQDVDFSAAWDQIRQEQRDAKSQPTRQERQKQQNQKRKEAKQAFLRLLRQGMPQKQAARQVGVAWATLYNWKQLDAKFRDAWTAIAEQQPDPSEPRTARQEVDEPRSVRHNRTGQNHASSIEEVHRMSQSVSTSDLVNNVAEQTGLSKAQAKSVVAALFEGMGQHLAAGDRIQVSGFGTFEVRQRAERQGTNPRTREKVTIPASKAVGFRAASALKDRVGADEETSDSDG